MQELVILGTGNATVTQCYNTCFSLNNGGRHLLVDAGGGNGILRQLEDAAISISSIESMLITHAHTDHLLGGVWIVRMVAQLMKKGGYAGIFSIYSHAVALELLEHICRAMLPAKLCALFGERIIFHSLQAEDRISASGWDVQVFDLGSSKALQYGFETSLADGSRLVCLGDEPLQEQNRERIVGAAWLLSEAFCLAEEAERFKPYEKHHSTAADAAMMAEELGVKNLLLYHTEDSDMTHRKSRYSQEAALHFSGCIHVPDDLERLALSV